MGDLEVKIDSSESGDELDLIPSRSETPTLVPSSSSSSSTGLNTPRKRSSSETEIEDELFKGTDVVTPRPSRKRRELDSENPSSRDRGASERPQKKSKMADKKAVRMFIYHV